MTHIRGESVYFDSSGNRWVGSLDLGRDGTGKRRRPRVTGQTEKAVRDKLRALRQDIEQGAVSTNRNVTVGQFLREWLEREVPKFTNKRGEPLSQNTLDNYEWSINKHLAPALGHVRLAKLTVDHVDEMLEAKAQEGMARTSMVALASHLGRALKHAQRRRLIPQNVVEFVTVPAGSKSERRSLTPDEAKRLTEKVGQPRKPRHKHGRVTRHPRTAALVTVGVTMGPRPGELLGLRWEEDTDLDEGLLYVQVQVVWERPRQGGPKQPRLKYVKTDGSRRTLRCPDVVVERLREWRTVQQELRDASGVKLDPEWGAIGLVFGTNSGRPMLPSNMRRDFRAACDDAGVDLWVPYEMRHTTASLLSDSGVHGEQVADVLGQKGTRMLDSVYRHSVRPVVEAGAAPMQELLTRSSEE